MILESPIDLQYPCLLITTPCKYNTETSIIVKNTIVTADSIYKAKAEIKVLGVLLRNIGDLFERVGISTPILSAGKFYYPGKCITVSRIYRQITKVTNKRIKVYGATYFIEHNNSDIRIPAIASAEVYAKLIEWEHMRFFIGYSYDKAKDKNVKI